MGENGPVTIREVYAMVEKVDSKLDDVKTTLAKFHTHCATKVGEFDKRVSLLEDKSDKLQYMGRENRGYIFYSLMMMLSAVIGAGAVLLVEVLR